MPTYTSQPAAAAGEDTWILDTAAITNNETQTTIAAAVYDDRGSTQTAKCLLRWTASEIPRGSRVITGTLSLYVNNLGSTAQPIIIGETLKPWDESEVTWTIYSSGNNWSTAGGAAGVDYSTKGSPASSTPGSAGSTFSQDVKNLCKRRTKNTRVFDFFMVQDGTTEMDAVTSFRSSDHGTSGHRPELEVVYAAPVRNRGSRYNHGRPGHVR